MRFRVAMLLTAPREYLKPARQPAFHLWNWRHPVTADPPLPGPVRCGWCEDCEVFLTSGDTHREKAAAEPTRGGGLGHRVRVIQSRLVIIGRSRRR